MVVLGDKEIGKVGICSYIVRIMYIFVFYDECIFMWVKVKYYFLLI